MDRERRAVPSTRLGAALLISGLSSALLWPALAEAQAVPGTLIVTVEDVQGGIVAGARVSMASPALIGGPVTIPTNDGGQVRRGFLPPGRYVLEVAHDGFDTYREDDLWVRAGATITRTVVLSVAGIAESVVVEGAGSQTEARDPGFSTSVGSENLRMIPTRRASMFDAIRAAPGISPTSPASGTVTTVSAFGSGTNENQFLIDGTNFTCPCNGVARAEPGVDFIQEVRIQSVGASAEFGNVQGAVINVVTRQGGAQFLYDAAYYAQSARTTSQPVRLPYPGGARDSGYERARYRDLTTSLGGPVVRDRLWFFTGYQHLRDHDSQPGTDPTAPRLYEQDKFFGKLTWRLASSWQLVQSMHQEFWVNPERPTTVTPLVATTRTHASVPAITFGHLTHTLSTNTVWEVRLGRFVYAQESPPSSGDRLAASRRDRVTGLTTGAPPQFGELTIARTTMKSTISHDHRALFGADHQWKVGGQIERGEHHGSSVIPTGVRFIDHNAQPFQAISAAPSISGGQALSLSVFASDAMTIGDRLTLNAGVRFDHSRAISQDLHAIDAEGRPTSGTIAGLGTLYAWNILSPRLGAIVRLGTDGRMVLRATYGRFSQGVLTGELAPFHPGGTPITTTAFDPATGGYTRVVSRVEPGADLRLDRHTRAPHTDELSVGLDREVGHGVALAVAYVRKDGGAFIGWTETGGEYRVRMDTLPDGRSLPVYALTNATSERRFVLTNPDGYSTTYNGVVAVVERRRSRGWQAFGSYTLSRASGLLTSAGTTAAGPQTSTVSPPNPVGFGRDPNDLTNARGRLPNDRPHMFRAMASLDVPRTGVVLTANLQHLSGKPWAATTQVVLPQGDQRILLEPRGSRRLSSQTLLDLRVSRAFRLGGAARIEVMVDLLNALGDSAEEGLATDNLFSPNFGRPVVFTDPRRAMLGVRVNLGH